MLYKVILDNSYPASMNYKIRFHWSPLHVLPSHNINNNNDGVSGQVSDADAVGVKPAQVYVSLHRRAQ